MTVPCFDNKTYGHDLVNAAGPRSAVHRKENENTEKKK